MINIGWLIRSEQLFMKEKEMYILKYKVSSRQTQTKSKIFPLTTYYSPFTLHFNNRFELDGMQFEEPVPNLFSFNNPFGACPTCEGFSQVLGIDATW